jgi:cytochrome c
MPSPARQLKILNAAQVALAICLFAGTLRAGPDSVQRGKEFARVNCARCHSIERTGESPLKTAPPFRALHKRYPVEYLEEALAEGIVTGHPDMPEFRLEPDQIADFIDFLKSLED